jgi:hypothetical protein
LARCHKLLQAFSNCRAFVVVDRLRKQLLQLVHQQHQGRPQRLIGVEFVLRRLADARSRARTIGCTAAAPPRRK